MEVSNWNMKASPAVMMWNSSLHFAAADNALSLLQLHPRLGCLVLDDSIPLSLEGEIHISRDENEKGIIISGGGGIYRLSLISSTEFK